VKRSDFIPDEELQRLLQLASDAPKGITDLAELAHNCNKEGIAQIDIQIENIKADIESDVFHATLDNGKPKYSNKEARTSELNRRLNNNSSYQSWIGKKQRLEIERNQKFTQLYEAKDTLKSVWKKLSVAVALQNTENLVREVEIINTQYLESEVQNAKGRG
jgi:hypothetical protein